MQCKELDLKSSTHTLTLAVNDVNKDVDDYDGACPADACTVGTTGRNDMESQHV